MLRFIKSLFAKQPAADLQLLQSGEALLLDVRTAKEFQEGHATGASNIPLDQLKQHIPALKKQNKPVITMCRSGARSGVASSMLQDHGIRAFNGGPWQQVQKRLVTKS